MLPEPAGEREPELGDIPLAFDFAQRHPLAAWHRNGLALARQVEGGELAVELGVTELLGRDYTKTLTPTGFQGEEEGTTEARVAVLAIWVYNSHSSPA